MKKHMVFVNRDPGGNACSVKVELDEYHNYVLTRFWQTWKYTIAWSPDNIDGLIEYLTELRECLKR